MQAGSRTYNKLFLIIFCVFIFFSFSSGASLPHYSIDKICAVGENTLSLRKTLETWIGKELPQYAIPGDAKLFTGFKIHRVYRFHNYFIKDGRALRLSYCENGKVKFESEKNITSKDDWSTPWCFFEDANTSDLSRFHCLKIARRKKYASQVFDFFMPHTWVAGIFYCDIEENQKKAIQIGLADTVDKHNYSEFCSLRNAIPIQPLFASNCEKAWTESMMKFSLPMPKIVKHLRYERFVPFLYTLNQNNFLLNSTTFTDITKFAHDSSFKRLVRIPGGQDLLEWYNFWKKEKSQRWYEEVRVDEAYTYNMRDRINLRRVAESFVANVTPFLNKLNLKDNEDGIGTIGEVRETFLRPLWKHLRFADKLLLANFSSIWEHGSVKNIWEKINISDEKVQYKKVAEQYD